MHRYILVLLLISSAAIVDAQTAGAHNMQIGVDADNWSGQTMSPAFADSLRKMKIDFISWHILPEEEADSRRLQSIVQFCHKNHWHYLFNTEIANYRRDDPRFRHPDGTFRYDVSVQTLSDLRNDPLFVGVVYDEADLMQALLGEKDDKGKTIEPALVNTQKMSASEAFFAVAEKVDELKRRYKAYGKSVIFEMTFPDYPFAFARGGATLAPKLLKENFNDLMYSVYRGASLEYHSKELWACVDLWFLDKFPFDGKYEPGDHTPIQLLETLKYAFAAGFDDVYVEQVKALMDHEYALSDYGRQVVAFQEWRELKKQGNWRTAPIQYYIKRFPDGNWGQEYSTFIPDHPYGSWEENPYKSLDSTWHRTLNELSHGNIPSDAETWNAQLSPHFRGRPYQTMSGLPPIVVFDQLGVVPAHTTAAVLDLTGKMSH